MQGDAKEREILELLAQGMTREQIAEKYGNSWKSVDQYMRRRGYKWSSEQQTYVIKEHEDDSHATMQLNTKAAQIIRMLNSKHPDIRQIILHRVHK